MPGLEDLRPHASYLKKLLEGQTFQGTFSSSADGRITFLENRVKSLENNHLTLSTIIKAVMAQNTTDKQNENTASGKPNANHSSDETIEPSIDGLLKLVWLLAKPHSKILAHYIGAGLVLIAVIWAISYYRPFYTS